MGIAQTPVRVRVADEQGHDCPLGVTGEVLVRGDSVMAGYWRNPAATTAALRDGWLWTGDLGSLDADETRLDAHCLAHIARFKRPKHYRFVDALPKNNYGKVLKTALRDRLRRTVGPVG